MDLIELLAQDSYVIINKRLMTVLGLNTAYLLSVLCSYARSFGNNEFYREQNKIAEDTGLSLKTVKAGINKLKLLGILQVHKKGLPAKNYYKINADIIISFMQKKSAFEILGKIDEIN